MMIDGREYLPVISCKADFDNGTLKLDKVAAFRLINGLPISFAMVGAEFSYLDFSYTIPLKLVPLLWGLRLWHKLKLPRPHPWYYNQWEKISSYQDPIKRVNTGITDFKIGVINE